MWIDGTMLCNLEKEALAWVLPTLIGALGLWPGVHRSARHCQQILAFHAIAG